MGTGFARQTRDLHGGRQRLLTGRSAPSDSGAFGVESGRELDSGRRI